MASKIARKNERAMQLNPIHSGMRTGNPQLESHDRKDVRLPKRQRAPRKSEKRK